MCGTQVVVAILLRRQSHLAWAGGTCIKCTGLALKREGILEESLEATSRVSYYLTSY